MAGNSLPKARLLALIKPQFEAGRAEVGKGGVVRDPAVHARVCAEVKAWLEAAHTTVALPDEPSTPPGAQCNTPYACGFRTG